MKSYNFFLNNKNVSTNQNNVFTYTFPNGFDIPEGSELSINSCSIPYSWFNVSSQLGNTTLGYNFNGTYYPVTLKDGFYLVSDLNAQLQQTLLKNGHYWYNSGGISSSDSYSTTFIGTISGTTLTLNASTITSLPVGTVLSGQGVTSCTITALASATTYTVSVSQTVSSATVFTAVYNTPYTSTAQINTLSPSIIYPLSIALYTPLYTNSVTCIATPALASIASTFGPGYVQANGSNGTTSWTGGYVSSSFFQLVIPTTNSTTTSIGNLLGFTTGSYPSAAPTGLSSTSYGNSLQANPAFPPKGSQVNGILLRCNLAENPISPIGQTDIVDFIPITSQFGSNIQYLPISDAYVKAKPGKHQLLQVTFNDDSGNTLYMQDPNIFLSLILKTPIPIKS